MSFKEIIFNGTLFTIIIEINSFPVIDINLGLIKSVKFELSVMYNSSIKNISQFRFKHINTNKCYVKYIFHIILIEKVLFQMRKILFYSIIFKI